MNDTFHRFADLPWELRDHIWNLAVRPPSPGIHKFKLYNQETDGVLKNASNVVFDESKRYICLRLAAPDCDKSSGTDICNKDNLSIYLIDGGLWTACKESRVVMERSFRCLHGSKQMLKSVSEQKKDDAAATGYFEGQDGQAYYFTVLPHRDLFLFQPQNLGTIDWSALDHDIPIGSRLWGFRGLRNIALEYNPEWGLQVNTARTREIRGLSIVKMIIQMSKEAGNIETLWFIDYNLTRTDDDAIEEDGMFRHRKPAVFYSRDKRFVEVGGGRSAMKYWKHIDGEKAYGDDYACDKSSTTFVSDVEDAVAGYWEFAMREPMYAYRLRLGVLAWDRRQV
ncbi:hypothetical protein NM208_g4835 [Fusarium decemcellulare]|uniref:Uncharacterized protein n=1 Tax=Fusarium decemcellulare TaxID=57161 RepID=A0ACC1SJ43_9HYPO|nr:hypothetical protein NM208_g4835 [Fusarium decemcellulare]